MIEVFNTISNIAKRVKKEVLDSSSALIDENPEDINTHCAKIIEKEFEWVKSVKAIIAKDKKQFCNVHHQGKYLVSFVAIDNPDLVCLDYSVGSIFGIYENELNPRNLIAAIYIAYGPTVQLVYASNAENVKLFCLEHNEFIQKDEISLKEKGKINSCAGDVQKWSKEHKALIDSFFNEGYRLRMSDSLVLDTHQILLKQGGIYSNPDMKFEHIFEAFPISYIVTLASGKASNGLVNILELQDFDLHSKTPLFFGSGYEMSKIG